MRNMRWGWILLAGVIAEVVAVVFLVGLCFLHGYEAAPAAPFSAAATDSHAWS
jgi:hypothetical protein